MAARVVYGSTDSGAYLMNSGFTAAAQAELLNNDRPYVSADLLQLGAIVAEDISMSDEDAFVSVDGTASIRRTFSMTVPDAATYLPLTATGLLSPFLTEIRVWSGVYYDDGTYDRWAIFTGGLDAPSLSDSGDLDLKISAHDRAQYISDRRFSFPYTIAAGTNVVTAIQAIVLGVMPLATFNSVSSSYTLPAVIVINQGDDRWEHCQDLAAAAGLEVFFDGSGTCIIQTVPNPDTQAAVWTFSEGVNAVIKQIDQSLSGTDSYSHAAAYSTTIDGTTPVRSDVYDTDPTSPTYYDPAVGASAFGDRIIELASDLLLTQAQTSAAATALLARKKRATFDVNFLSRPITGLDEHDVVRIERGASNLDSYFMLESFGLPLSPGGEMDAKCRSQRV